MRQVLLNFIDNSIKYIERGFIKVELSHYNNGKIWVAISDSGIGISKENIPKLFEKFSRGSGRKVNTGAPVLAFTLQKKLLSHIKEKFGQNHWVLVRAKYLISKSK